MLQSRNMINGRLGAWTAFVMAAVCLVPVAASATSLASVVTDSTGDAYMNGGHQSPSFRDITRVEVTKSDGNFVFTMDLAGSVPDEPNMQGPAHGELWWWFGITLNLSVTPRGFPGATGSWHITWWDVVVQWDGENFTGFLVDRLPLLDGHDVVITPIAFEIDGSQITMVVDSDLMDNPSSFMWAGVTMRWTSGIGTESIKYEDIAPEFFTTGILATWPA